MMDRAEITISLPPQVLDRLRRESLACGLPLPWLVAALVAALAEVPADALGRLSKTMPRPVQHFA
jgi:hypothetical protein